MTLEDDYKQKGWIGAVQGDCQPYSSKTEDSLDNSYLAWFLGVHGPLVKD